MTGINDIKAMALAYGACNKVLGITSIKEAVELLMTPQGREFAVKSGFPTLDTWRMHPYDVDRSEMVLLDMGVDNFSVNEDYIVVGNTSLEATFDCPDRLYYIIAMHGATVEIKASNYAVVTVTSINATVNIINDGTAKITVEQSEKGGES